MAERCVVIGCDRRATHLRVVSISAEWAGIEDLTTSVRFCCSHIDAMANESEPYLDLAVVGRIRGADDS